MSFMVHSVYHNYHNYHASAAKYFTLGGTMHPVLTYGSLMMALVGAVIYITASQTPLQAKIGELGRLVFQAGMLAFAFQLPAILH